MSLRTSITGLALTVFGLYALTELGTRNTGEIHTMLSRAINAGLLVHPYTVRAEEPFLTQTANGISQTALAEAIQLYGLGVNGFFIDQPGVGVQRARSS